jgi:hypothetical protein
MPLSSELDARGFTRLTLDGQWPSIDDLVAWYRSVGDIRDVHRLLIDMRGTTGPLPKFPKIRETLGAFDTNNQPSRERRRAVIVSSDVQFGVARSFQALVPGDMAVFRDEASAIAWLLT